MWRLLDFCDFPAHADEALCLSIMDLSPVITELFLSIIALTCGSLAKIVGMF